MRNEVLAVAGFDKHVHTRKPPPEALDERRKQVTAEARTRSDPHQASTAVFPLANRGVCCVVIEQHLAGQRDQNEARLSQAQASLVFLVEPHPKLGLQRFQMLMDRGSACVARARGMSNACMFFHRKETSKLSELHRNQH